jgi:hypothetical protein
VPRSTSMQKHSSRRKEFRQFLGNSRSHDSVAISRRFALRIEPLGLMERLTTESVRAEIDRSSRPAISERDDVTVPLAPGTRDQEQSTSRSGFAEAAVVPARRPLRCSPTGRRRPDTTASTAGNKGGNCCAKRMAAGNSLFPTSPTRRDPQTRLPYGGGPDACCIWEPY